MVGGYLKKVLMEGNFDVFYMSRVQFENQNFQSFSSDIVAFQPAAIIHLAAETNVDLCEREPNSAFRSNVLLTTWIARVSASLKAKMIYVSSSSIFGKDERFLNNEMHTPAPISIYANSKLAGERIVADLCSHNYVLVRAGWMVGGGRDNDRKFVGNLINQIKGGTREILAVNDKWGSVTHAAQLAQFLAWSLDDHAFGLYHYACKGAVSRFLMAEVIMHSASSSIRPMLRGVSSAHFPLSAPRPFSDAIESVRQPELPGKLCPGDWSSVLRDYVNEFR
jgi:dTDP-4-dehydrorhamnose reductase